MDYSSMKAKEVKRKPYSYEKSKATEGKRKQYSYEKDLAREAKQVKRALGRSAIAWIVVVLCLIIGGIGGFFAHKYAFKNDTYHMLTYANGEADICIGADEEYQTYSELGVKCIAFGKDLSKECTVAYYYRSDMTEKEVKVDKVDEHTPGIYYAVYTAKSPKYKSVKLIRNIIVMREED